MLTLIKKFVRGLISAPEASLVRYLRLQNRFPPLFIVGPARSGTTVVYLHLINTFRLAYLPNISRPLPLATATAAALGRLFFSYRPTYDNTYGVVPGPMAPSDGWTLFHRWFPEHDHSEPTASDRLYELRNTVRLLEIIFGAPFAVKNNNNSTRIEELSQTFPDALFVHVKRDIVDASLSLVQARRACGIEVNQWWSVAPPTVYDQTFSSETEQAAVAIRETNSCIRRAFQDISPARRLVLQYEDFCTDPSAFEHWVQSTYAEAGATLQRRDVPTPSSFEARHRVPTKATEEKILAVSSHLSAGGPTERVGSD